LTALIERRFKHGGDVEMAETWVRQSKGIERTKVGCSKLKPASKAHVSALETTICDC
jgi:geranylgeranyl pyrophosphate synthase